MKKILKITGILFSLLVAVVAGALIYLNTAYPKVDPPKDIKINPTAELISRGEYLANHVAVCMDCHSVRDFSKFSGPIVKGTEGKGGELFDQKMGLPGKIYVKNITPAALADWTDGELIRAITMGVNKKNEALFPMMPYPHYNEMSEEDLYSVIAYLRTLEPIEGSYPDKELDFPLNHLINTMPIQTYKPAKIDKSNPAEYGKYLVTMASCNHCHTPSEKGEPVAGMDYAGGAEINLPFGTLRSANITPDLQTGIGAWTKEIFIAKFKAYDPAQHEYRNVSPGEFNSVMPWTMYAGMTEEDLGAIYDYLRTLKPIKNQVVRFTPNNQ